jgi:hypothetical protein
MQQTLTTDERRLLSAALVVYAEGVQENAGTFARTCA